MKTKRQKSPLLAALLGVGLLTLISSKAGAQQVFLGMTDNGGSYNGTIFKFNPSTNIETVEWNLGGATDGANPFGNLVYDPVNGFYYAMTLEGGSYGTGAIIRFNPVTNEDTVVWNFGSGTDGSSPDGSLVYDAGRGLFYGMTSSGGSNSGGTIISFDPVTSAESVLWNFAGGTDGKDPYGSLIYDATNGLFYGMTQVGGANSLGTIISFNPTGNTEAVVWSFGSGSDGTDPWGELVYDPGNKLYYGMTAGGGSHSVGTIFSFNPTGNTEAVVWSFGSGTDGASPYGDLVYDTANKLFYGMTYGGGSHSMGSIISFNPATSAESVVWNFGSGTDGAMPYGSLTYYSPTQLFYGLATYGGADDGAGAIISFNPTGNAESVLYSFKNSPDGVYPRDNLVLYPPNSGEGVEGLQASNGNVTVYPNPSNGKFNLQIVNGKLSMVNEMQVEVYNVFGQEIYTSTLAPQTPKGALSVVDLSSQPDGVYLYRVISPGGELIGEGKVVIEK